MPFLSPSCILASKFWIENKTSCITFGDISERQFNCTHHEVCTKMHCCKSEHTGVIRFRMHCRHHSLKCLPGLIDFETPYRSHSMLAAKWGRIRGGTNLKLR